MPLYRVTARSFFDREYGVGEKIDFDGIPGTNLDPLDDAARAAKEAADAARQRRAGLRSVDGKRPLEPLPPQEPVVLTEIPEDWRDLSNLERIKLARKLGAPSKGTTAAKADEHIEAELARRATV